MGKRLCAPLFALLFLVTSLPALSASPPASNPAPNPQETALAAAVESAQKAIQRGPQDVPLSGQATLKLPADFGFVPAAEAAQYLRALGNTPGESLAGMVVPLEAQKGDWLVVINYVPSGYIKDDDAKEWDADELLESIRAGTEEDNQQRVQMGIPEMEIIGWVEKPIYDDQTKRLVWSISSRGKGLPAAADNGINYNTYALGREGYYTESGYGTKHHRPGQACRAYPAGRPAIQRGQAL